MPAPVRIAHARLRNATGLNALRLSVGATNPTFAQPDTAAVTGGGQASSGSGGGVTGIEAVDTANRYPEFRLPLGGDIDRAGLSALARAARQTSTWKTVVAASADLIGTFGSAAVAGAMVTAGPAVALGVKFGVAAAAVVIGARCQRGSECLVHEGSHHNWLRSSEAVNDRLCNLLAAYPVGITVQSFRASHKRHHDQFGTVDDPDLQRYRELEIEALDVAQGSFARLRICASLMPSYIGGWIRSAGMNRSGMIGAAMWQLAFFGSMATTVGTPCALAASASWLFAYLIALPVVRFMGEAEEHNYVDATSVADATISNLGVLDRLLVHPHGDGYHVAHHLWPQIPHHSLKAFHLSARVADNQGYGRSKVASRFRSPRISSTHRK